MSHAYVFWALLGMAAYSLTTLLVKLAVRTGAGSSFMVLLIATAIVFVFVTLIVWWRGGGEGLLGMDRAPLLWSLAAGVALFVAVSSLFQALSLGPASVVVPIYGMFVIGGAALGILVLQEPLTWNKVAGLAAAVIGIVLISV
jgi:transporter family protein